MEALIVKEKKSVLLGAINTATKYGPCLGFKNMSIFQRLLDSLQ